MFGTEFGDSGDPAVVEAVAHWQAAESSAAARRLAAIAELAQRRCADDKHPEWACDGWDAAAAEIAAALGISHSRASGQMNLGLTLRHRLPAVAALLWAGRISLRVVSTIAWRTGLVTDPDALAQIDAETAECAARYDTLSAYKLDQAIDVIIDRHDPGALRRARASLGSRDVTIGPDHHESGTAAFWGRLLATDATMLHRRLEDMARSVCDNDPRTVGQRRADALGALAAGAENLSCRCGDAGCPTGGPDPRGSAITITVIADQSAIRAATATARQAGSTEPPGAPGPTAPPAQCPAPAASATTTGATSDSGTTTGTGTAVLIGGGVVPTPLLAELLRIGATLRPMPTPAIEPEPGYRPSAALARFIRARDMTCRFPGCDVPAERCDIDHSIPWPFGPTHPSNCHLKCRKHHLLKTFYGGPGGWREIQHPDATITWTSPTGRVRTTVPGSRLLLPHWDTTTATLTLPAAPAPAEHRGLMMPIRRRTRAQDRAARIRRERALNDSRVAELNRPPPF